MTKIMKCTCNHSYQDTKHGKKRRVFNMGAKVVEGVFKWYCSVCGNEIRAKK